MADPAPAPAAPVPPPPPAAAATITIDEFKKIVLKVDLGGGEVRQVVSGIKQWYAPEQLVGKSVILVANLAPAVLRGVESQGMVLAASSGDQVILLSLEKDAAPGSKVS